MKEQKTQNKGEISEVYVFFRILGDCAIYPCDKELKRTGSSRHSPITSKAENGQLMQLMEKTHNNNSFLRMKALFTLMSFWWR